MSSWLRTTKSRSPSDLLHQQGGDLLLHNRHGGGRNRLHENDVQPRFPVDALQLRGVRHNHHVVLIRAHRRKSFSLQYADDLARNIADADHLAQGVAVREQLFGHGLAHDAHLGGGAHLFRPEDFAFGQRPLANLEVFGRFALHHGVPVLIAGDHLRAGAVFRAHGGDAINLRLNRQGVFQLETVPVAPAQAGAAGTEGAGENEQHVLPQTGDLLLHLLLGAAGDAHRGDHGADADDHAQHGQHGAHFVAPQSPEGDAKCGKNSHSVSLMAWCASRRRRNSASAFNRLGTSSSVTIWPSRKTTLRFV
jgi:hypothetical protein